MLAIRHSLAVLVVVIGVAAGSDTNIDSSPDSTIPAEVASGAALNYVAFGDSWPEGAHCNGCTTFAGLWAEGLEAQTGAETEFIDLTGAAEASSAESKTSESLLASMRTDESTRAAVQAADIILIATGPNEIEAVFGPLLEGTCGGPDGFDCIRALGQVWGDNFEAILTEIDTLRDGAPTAVRLVNAANPFVSVPEMNQGLPDDFATTGGALIFELLTVAMCDAAAAHDAACVDVRPILNGPTMDQAVDENSPESMQAITDALLAIGLPEISTGSPSAGRIVFQRAPGGEVVEAEETDVYVMNADGSDEQLLAAGAAAGRWSPDGTEFSIFCCDDGMAAHLVDVDSGDVRGLEPPDPTLETFCGLWSPDGERLACEGYGVDDPSRNGVYSILASDGGGLTRITSNPAGGDIPGDYSPDGTRLVFMRFEDDVPTGLFVIDIADDGAGEGEPRQLTPAGMVLDDSGQAGRWSPDGEEILFVARESEDDHKAIWVVNVGADGGAPHQLAIAPGCGGPLGEADAYGCYSPDWSPDGDRIVFTRSEPDGSNETIWIVGADGSDLAQLTDGTDDNPAWGPPPSTT